MNYIERGCSSITAMSTETKLGDDRIISIKGLITSETADAFAEQVLILNRQSTEDPITVLNNSAGGAVPQGERAPDYQISLADVGADQIRKTLLSADLNSLTPIEAMNLLYELQRKARS